MPTSNGVVSDTSPLLNLALIDRLDLLAQQFETVTVPEQVWEELTAGEDGVEALQTLRDKNDIDIVAAVESDLYRELRRTLDKGEAAALSYAIEIEADLLLLDEQEARAAAKRHNLSVTGVIGVLLRGSATGDVVLEAELEALREAGFWISDDLYQSALERDPSRYTE